MKYVLYELFFLSKEDMNSSENKIVLLFLMFIIQLKEGLAKVTIFFKLSNIRGHTPHLLITFVVDITCIYFVPVS